MTESTARERAEEAGREILEQALEEGWGRRKLANRSSLSRHQARGVLEHLRKGGLTLDHIESDKPVGVGEEEIDTQQYLTDDRVFKNERTGRYVFLLQSSPKPVIIPPDQLEGMKRAYSNWDGAQATINELCRNYEIPRPWFQEIKSILGWTHDSEPFTEEEMMEKEEDELVEEALQLKRNSLYRKFEQKKYRETEKAAEKWREFERYVFQPLTELLEDRVPEYEPPELSVGMDPGPHCLVYPPYDLHFGKGAWRDETGESYSREEARGLLIDKTEQILARAQRAGIEKVIVPIGSDWFHVDTDKGTTTSGTPQDTDGTPARILMEGCELAVSMIDLLRQAAPVEIHHVQGNHDRMASLSAALYVRAWYKDAEDVTVDTSPDPTAYTTYGRTLIGMNHGDMTKKMRKRLGGIMAEEADQFWSETDHRVMFVGHLHNEKVTDQPGVTVYQLPSLSATDRWHKRNQYIGTRRAAAGYLVHDRKGVVENLLEPVLS